MTTVFSNIAEAAPMDACSACKRCSKTSTAKTAPMGSITMPSHFNVDATRLLGRTCRSSGPITVGPVTVRIPPSRKASSQSKPKIKWAAMATNTNVIAAPTVQRRSAALPASRNSESFNDNPPSNMMTATDNDTSGNSKLGPADLSPPVTLARNSSG